MGKFLCTASGNPTVVVKFMPGAGSTKSNWFQEQKHRTVP